MRLPRPLLLPMETLAHIALVLCTATALRAVPTNIFAFDDDLLPHKSNLKLTFETPQKFAGNPVLTPGPAGAVDAAACSFYGSIIRVGDKFRMWYSAKSDRSISTGNLTPSARIAYAESDDGLHFREPVADYVFIPAGGDRDWDARGLLHGQGFEHVGDKTCIYYGTWDLSGGIRQPGAVGLANFGRDRLAALSLRDDIPAGAQFTSKPLANAGAATLSLNVAGLSDTAVLRIELIDKSGTLVPGYSGADAAKIKFYAAYLE